MNDFAQAEMYYNEALTLAESLGYLDGHAKTHNHLATLYAKQGKLDGAALHRSQAITLFEQIGNQVHLAGAKLNMAFDHNLIGQQRSTALSPTHATPKADLVPPHGGLNINGGATSTPGPKITLNLFASDTIDPHNDGENRGSYMTPPADSASGMVEMMVNPRSDMQGGMWKPYVMTKSQTLNRLTGLASVFVNYRDAAGNESEVYAATIHIGAGSPGLHAVYRPVIRR